MAINKGSNKTAPIYYGSNKIAKAYLGSTLVYRTNSGLPEGQIIFGSGVAGNTSITIAASGYYLFELVGAGGGAYVYQDYDNPNNTVQLGGSAGGYLKFTTWLPAGTYQATIGAAGSFGSGDIDGAYTAATNGGNTSFLNQTAIGGLGYSGTPRPSVNSLSGSGTSFNHQALPTYPEDIYSVDSFFGGSSSGKYWGVSAFSGAGNPFGQGGGWSDASSYQQNAYNGYIKVTAVNG